MSFITHQPTTRKRNNLASQKVINQQAY